MRENERRGGGGGVAWYACRPPSSSISELSFDASAVLPADLANCEWVGWVWVQRGKAHENVVRDSSGNVSYAGAASGTQGCGPGTLELCRAIPSHTSHERATIDNEQRDGWTSGNAGGVERRLGQG